VRKSLIVLGLLAPLWASATSIVNGDFEALGTGWMSTPVIGFADISAYDLCCANNGGPYPGGQKAAFFGAGDNTGGSIYQDIATLAGQQYTVTFDYGAIAAPNLQSIEVSAADALTSTAIASETKTATGTFDRSLILSSWSFTFTAASTSTRLTFLDVSATTISTDGVLDNVSISAVPEAGSISMFLAGLAMMGFIARRRLT
jgi:Protein of unknown function (DUF642)/PEP-CTERM motif